ncbi:MAG: LysM peptidoglycan-binding domain-containing protein [Candidatus Marinimicrobia bacterium]|jgi:membrane-bound lytic murein transglycosylase D|nr:LysM peptidoglycan-binding domain-containing protein [Candidatus Neomarinimicrobiota bacterium]MBT3618515.1 LysM peptidoglycan-binding domain-containing protein [Candidatus Neomarinimicrobiota bacterium]MBT3828921.1 LysM peptidoglycan-binding domain-containing protein [Candidatus Neomarinimicrobiota bacterium]MBT3997305.1 LysM peptidoglycan-binding domain-containing protein [Candidatus Neomarinimicrobiota bacterium]MBT4281173.1 LysM peptidoglycan-binding domain-containing protein [Candidatus
MLRIISIIIVFCPILDWTPAQDVKGSVGSNGVGATILTAVAQKATPVNGINETGNRLPLLLRDVKVLLAEAMIADVNKDTLEVLYSLDRIFELLAEADQFGEMRPQDREEFDRYEQSLMDLYTHRFETLEVTDASITAEKLRNNITEFVEPLEVEMGSSQFTVIDDRDGHIPLVRNKQVDQFIEFFQTKGKKQFQIWLNRYIEYGELIGEILREEDMPQELIFLAMIESGLNPRAYSKANAAGIWQFIYSTGKSFGLKRTWYVDERRDPIKSTHAAADFLKGLYQEFDHWYLAMAAYNCGEGRVRRAIRLHQTSDFWQLHSLPRETRNYLPYYLAAAIIGRAPDQYGFSSNASSIKPFEFDLVKINQSADLTVIARSAGINLKTLKLFNPELRQSATPSEGSYSLRIPKGRKETFFANFTALPNDQKFAQQNLIHKVKRGESLWTISSRYKVSIHDLAAVNKIRNRHKIQIGQKLTVPIKGGVGVDGGPPGHYKVVYKVKRGDTLGQIAEDYGTRTNHIRRWNNINYGDYIHPKQKLVLWIKG